MKKYLLILTLLLITNISADAQMSAQETLSVIENTVFGYDYKEEPESKRIERIEQHLYGQKKNGSITKRIENIQNDTGLSMPTEEKKNRNSISQQAKKDLELASLQEDSTVEYPMVNKMEEELFNTTYKKENIYTRLNRLEERVFNKTNNEDLNTRVDKLASVLRPKTQKMAKQNNYDYYRSDMDNYYNNRGLEPIDNQSIQFQLAAIEEDLLRNSYMNENISNRLSRLEQKLFNRTFATDTDIMRLQRIMVAYDAKKNSYKYENNRKMQNMATASQIGGILLMILAMLL